MKRLALRALQEEFDAARVSAQRIVIERVGGRNENFAGGQQAGIVERLEGKVAIGAIVVLGADARALAEPVFDGGDGLVGANRQQAARAQRRGQQRDLRVLRILPPAEMDERGRRQGEGRGGLRRHHRDAIDGVMVPARAGGEVQAAGPGHPRLLHVAARVHGGAVEVVEQARRGRIRLVLVRESSVAQAPHGPAGVERAARVPHPRGRGVPDPLAVIAGAQRKVGGITVAKLLAHPGGVVHNQQFVGGSVAPAQVAEGVMVARAHQRIDAQLAGGRRSGRGRNSFRGRRE